MQGENDRGKRTAGSEQSVAAESVQPQRQQRIRLQKSVESVLRVQLRMGNDVRRGEVIRQILQRRNIDEQERPGAENEQERGEQEDQATVGKLSEPRRQATEALGR